MVELKKQTGFAVILTNLGTPKSPQPSDVRAFLKPFLSDRRVVEVPRPIWMIILHAFILPFRPKSIGETYAELWDEYGDSPLRIISNKQVVALQQQLADSARVYLAMTYGEPSIEDAFAQAKRDGYEKVVVLPLYPQYSGSTTGAVMDQVAKLIQKSRDIPDMRWVKSYYDHPKFIAAIAQSIKDYWQENGRGEYLLMSYHGIPQAYVDKGDPYERHCKATSQLVAEHLGLSQEEWGMSFQSRLGKAKWLTPYTIDTVKKLGKKAVKQLDVVCPAFAADCIETIEEITIENGEDFVKAGGGELRLIPCLNDRADHIALLAELARSKVN